MRKRDYRIILIVEKLDITQPPAIEIYRQLQIIIINYNLPDRPVPAQTYQYYQTKLTLIYQAEYLIVWYYAIWQPIPNQLQNVYNWASRTHIRNIQIGIQTINRHLIRNDIDRALRIIALQFNIYCQERFQRNFVVR